MIKTEDIQLEENILYRRIDDLGRIVIPKQTRRELRINEGDPLEIIKTADGVLLKKLKFNDAGELERV